METEPSGISTDREASVKATLAQGGRRHVHIVAIAAVDVKLAGTRDARLTTPEYADFAEFDCPPAGDDAGMLALVRAALWRLLAECYPNSSGDDPAEHFCRAWLTILADDGPQAVHRLATVEWNRDDPDGGMVLTIHSPPPHRAASPGTTVAGLFAQLWLP